MPSTEPTPFSHLMSIREFVAWVLDFEGSISVSKSYDQRRDRFYYSAAVKVLTTSVNHLQHLEHRVGFGRTNPIPSIVENGNDKFQWALSVSEIREHLPNIKPFLFLKQRQAEIVLELLKLKLPLKAIGYSKAEHYTPALYEQLDTLWCECRKLNERVIGPRSAQDEFYRVLRKR